MKIKLPDAETIRQRLREVSDHPLNEELYDLIAGDAGSERTPDGLIRILTAAIYIHVQRQGLARVVHGAYLMNMEWYVAALTENEQQAHETMACYAEMRGYQSVATYHRRLVQEHMHQKE